jgi:two-component system chemotaxis response regulator CheB
MSKVRVLIADDSVVYRSQIKAALSNNPWIDIVGTASNGRFAIERLQQSPVDLLILDLEMPEMDGIQTLTELRAKGFTCKTLVFSSASKRGAEITMDALRLGAADFIAKPSAGSASTPETDPSEKIRALLLPKVQALFPQVESTAAAPSSPRPAVEAQKFPSLIWDLVSPQIIVIGSSTGGPSTLEEIFSQLTPPVSCPIVIAQHMPPIFTATLADRLSKASGIPAKEAKNGEILSKNCIYIAPGDFHLKLAGKPDCVIACLDQGPQVNWVRPAVDPLFSTAASIFGARCLAIVLTGMGSDGRYGAEAVKQAGGAVVIQSEKSCVVFGMPGAVFAANAYDRIASPREIVSIIQEKASLNCAPKKLSAVGE